MSDGTDALRRAGKLTGLLVGSLLVAACSSPLENFAVGAVGATVLGGQAPTQEIQQIYYFGVFDPQDQLPPQMYRIRVHGQASFISFMQFASGWVPAQFIDSLSTSAKFGDAGGVEISEGDSKLLSDLAEGRRLVLFGPQGFRPAPKDHRLVIVMGSSPEAFFSAIDQTAGKLSEAIAERRDAGLARKLFRALTLAKADRERLAELKRDLEVSNAQQRATAK